MMRNPLLLRLLAPTVGLSVVLLGVSGLAAWYLHQLHSRTSEQIDNHVRLVHAVENFDLAIRDIRFALCEFLIEKQTPHLRHARAEFEQAEGWLDKIKRLSTSESDKHWAALLRTSYRDFGQQLDRLIAHVDRDAAATREQVWGLLQDELTTDLRAPSDRLLQAVAGEMSQMSSTNKRIASRMTLVLLLLGVCGSVAGLLVGSSLARGVRRSVMQLQVPIKDAAGKLNEVVGPITLRGSDRIEELETTLHKLGDQVGSVVQRLQYAQQQALRAEQLAAVGQLAAGLAHELRNPLMAMKILVQSALDDEQARLTREDLQILDAELLRLERLVQNFLDFARPSEHDKQRVNLTGILEQKCRLIAPRAKQQAVTVDLTKPAGDVVVEADPGQVRQLVLNLLINALDAMPSGGRIDVELQATTDQVVLSIADTGCGLPTDLGERIFEPFVSTKETGTGLGLAICRRIVQHHEGAITAANQPDGGALITVRLPITHSEENDPRAATSSHR